MDRTYLINTQKLTQYGFIHANVEEDTLSNSIWRVQETEVQPTLGTPLYKALLEKIDAGLTSGVYYDLMVEKIIPYLIAAVEVKVVFVGTTEIENKGTGKNKDEYMTAATLAEANNLRDNLRKDATFFQNQLIKHLCDDNGKNFPEWLERTGNVEDFIPDNSGPNYKRKISIL